MPFRRPSQPTDLERVARILSAHRADRVADSEGGWVPRAPGRAAAALVERLGRALDDAAPEADDDAARLDADLRRARRPALLSVPDQLRAGRTSMSSVAVVALLALAVAVGCAFVLRVLWAERSADSGPVASSDGSRSVEVRGAHAEAPPGGPSAGSATGTATGAATGSSAGSSGVATPGGSAVEVVVHVVGQVARPGLVRLQPGARVADAIAAAGGARRGADLGALNLARVVVDGEQVYVPAPGQAPAPGAAGPAAARPSAGAGTAGNRADGGGAAVASNGVATVSLNTADLATLDTLPGVGPVLAQRIIDWRTQHGRFTSVDELGEVSGIGDKLMAQLRPKVTL